MIEDNTNNKNVLTTLVHLSVGLGVPLPRQNILTFCPFSASSLASLLEWMDGGAESGSD